MMSTRTTLTAAFATAVFATAPLMAQTAPATAQSAATSSATVATAPAGERTITGCIGSGAEAGSFIVTEAPTSVSATPTAGATTPAPTPTSWTLMAHADVDLSKYAGKKVELTGSSDMKGGVSADKTQSTTRSPKSTTGPRFHVRSVKVLADTCS